MNGISGIVFDKDGTLFDFQSSWARWTGRLIADLAGGDGVLADRLAAAAGYDAAAGRLRPDSIIIAHTEREAADALAAVMPPGTAPDAVFRRMRETVGEVENVPVVPLAPLFSALRARGLRLGLVTNDSAHAAGLHLKAAGVHDHFHFVAGYDSGHGAKPAPGPLLAFAEAVGLDPGRCLMVGDSLHDLVAGRAAGMATLGVLTGPASAEDLAPMADAVLDHIGLIPDWLGAS